MSAPVVVTGASGFVGRHLVTALQNRGEAVRAVDLAFNPPVAGAECLTASVMDSEAMARICHGAGSVFHCAANPQLWAPRASAFEEINVGGTTTMLEAATAAGVDRFIHVSSYVTLMTKALAGQTVSETAKTTEHEMLGLYPRSKWISEHIVLNATSGPECIAVLLPAPVGPLDYRMTPPTKLVRDLINGRVPAVINCLMNVVDVRDLADGLVRARDKGTRGERYLLTGEDLTINAFLDVVRDVSGVEMPSAKVPVPVAWLAALVEEKLIAPVTGRAPNAPLTGVQLAATRIRFDNSKARRELGFNPAPTRMALSDALVWMRDQGWLRREITLNYPDNSL